MIGINRVFGIDVDKAACDALGLDIKRHTVTVSSCQVKLIYEWEDLQDGCRLLGVSDINNPDSPRKFTIVNLSNLGFM